MTTQLQALIRQHDELTLQIKQELEKNMGAALAAAEQSLDAARVHPELAAAYFQRIRGKKFFFGGAPVPKCASIGHPGKRASGVKVAPKYRHKVTGATWSGRGKKPIWYASAEQSDIEHLGGDRA